MPDDSVHFASQDRPESILSCTVTEREDGAATYRMNLIAESYLDVTTDAAGLVTDVIVGQFVKAEEFSNPATEVSGNRDDVLLSGSGVFGQDDAVSFRLLNETIREVCTTE